MATSTEAPRPDTTHYVDYEEYVDFQLEKTRSSIKFTDIFTTLTALAVAVIGYLLIFVLLDQWVIEGGFGYAARVGQLCVLLAVVVGTLTWRVLLPVIRRIHPLYAARVIEKSDPNLKSNLVNFVDVRQANAQSAPIVMKAMQKRAAVELSHIDVEEAVDRRPLLRIAYALLAVVIVCALYIFFSPKDPFASVRRALLPTAPIEVATETTISEVDPGDKNNVPARISITVSADIRGKDADTAQILYTTADHKYVDQAVRMDRVEPTSPRFSGVLNGENGRGLLQNLTYRIVAGDARTRVYAINVIPAPSARVDEVQYEFPKYMGLENRTSAEGHIDGWEGTSITVKATANVRVDSARIVLTDTEDPQARGEEINMFVTDGTSLSATWKLEFRSDGSSPHFYHIAVTKDRQSDIDPTQYTYRVRPDQRPEVALLAPTSDLEMPSNGIIPLIIQAADPDFQVRFITLKAERNGEPKLDKKLFENRLPAPAVSGNYDFALAPLKLSEGNTLQFWIEAKDNKHPVANRASTPRINVRIGKPASAEEVEQQLAEEKKKQDQLAQADNQRNPERPDASPPPDSGEDNKPGNPETRPEPRDPQERAKPEPQPPEKEPDAAPGQAQKDQRRPDEKNRPDSLQEALQKLLQKEQEQQQQQPGEKQSDQEQPQPGEQKKNTEKNARQPNAGERENDGEKSPGASPKNSKNPGKNAGKPSDDVPGKDQPKPGDRARGKNENPDRDSRANSTKDPQQNKSDSSDKEKQQRNGKKQTGDNPGGAGQAEDEETPSKSGGDQQGKSAKTPGSKSAPGEKKDGADEQNPGKSDDIKKPGAGKQSGDRDQSGDSGADKAPKKDSEKNGAGNDEDEANNGAEPKNSGTKDPGKKDPGKGDDQAKTGDQPDGKNDPSKSGQTGDDPQKSGDDKPSADKDKAKNSPPGGAGKDENKASDPAGKSNDPSKSAGSPNDSDKPEGDSQPSDEGGGKKTPKAGRERGRETHDADKTGKEEPADESPDAVKKKADGTEAGEATGDNDGDPDAPKASDKVTKKPASEAGAKKKSQGDSKPDSKPGDKRQPDEGNPGSSADPDKARRPADGKEPTERPGQLDEPQSPDRQDLTKSRESEKRPGQPPDGGNPDLKGEGSKNQKSKQSDSGERGAGETADQGKPGGNQTGSGDQADEAGDTDSTKTKTGRPGDKKGKGSATRPTDEQGQRDSSAGNESGKEASSKKNKGKSGNQAGKSGEESDQSGGSEANGQKGKPGGQKAGGNTGESGKDGAGNQSGTNPDAGKANGQSGEPGKPGNSGSSPRGRGITGRPGEGNEPGDDGTGGPSDGENAKPRDVSSDDEPPSPEEDAANLEHARKATNLVLTRLKEQLERGEVDQKLLDELGWKDRKDLERLVKFLDQGLNNREDDNSPEALAREQQFEELLKSLRLGNETGSRSGGAGTTRRVRAVGDRNVPVPPEYRKIFESYTRSLSKNPDSPAKKK
jgi:hypothetical protein